MILVNMQLIVLSYPMGRDLLPQSNSYNNNHSEHTKHSTSPYQSSPQTSEGSMEQCMFHSQGCHVPLLERVAYVWTPRPSHLILPAEVP